MHRTRIEQRVSHAGRSPAGIGAESSRPRVTAGANRSGCTLTMPSPLRGRMAARPDGWPADQPPSTGSRGTGPDQGPATASPVRRGSGDQALRAAPRRDCSIEKSNVPPRLAGIGTRRPRVRRTARHELGREPSVLPTSGNGPVAPTRQPASTRNPLPEFAQPVADTCRRRAANGSPCLTLTTATLCMVTT